MSSNDSPNNPLDFAKNLWGNMGFSLPGMVAPTFDVDELEKRLTDLKAVEGWLKMNLSMLQMTIQGLEMQSATLKAVREMSRIKPGQAVESPTPKAESPSRPEPQDNAADTLQTAMWPWALMQQIQTRMQEAAEKQTAAPTKETEKPTKKTGKKTP